MPQDLHQVVFNATTLTAFNAIATKDQNAIYYLTDTHQIYVGGEEFTKSIKGLNAVPTASTPGDTGRIYYYDGNLYACGGLDGSTYVWTRIANINDAGGSVTSVGAGDGLGVADGSTNPITNAGEIVHAIPTGAAVHTDPGTAQTPTFGGTFTVETVGTDKFGHVNSVTESTVTLPDETAVSVTNETGTATTLDFGDSFTVVTEVAKGDGSHEIERTATQFTLPPAPQDLTYTISSDGEGEVTLTPSAGNAQTITIDGWGDLAKKSEIAAVFKFKGTVATVSALPTVADVGDVYHVTAKNAEYVCVQASTTDPQADAVWEELGTDIDLSGYIEKVTGATNEVPKFNADGSISSTGFTLGTSVPADAVFTDTTYDPATQSEDGLMSAADKTKLDGIESGAQVNDLEGVQVDGTDLTITNKKVNIQLDSFSQVSVSGGVTTIAADITGTAAQATADGSGNNIASTYATKDSVSWHVI